jgi:hypothetical protein
MTQVEIFNFNHEEADFPAALGLPKTIDTYCREIVYFCSITNHLLGKELFDNEADIPKALTTKTGDLEKCLTFVKTDIEHDYLLLVFHKAHELALDIIGKYNFLEQATDTERKQFEIMMKVLELKLDEKVAEEGRALFETPAMMMNRIDLVKQSRYDFKKYLNLVAREVEDVRTLLDEQENN